MASSPTTSSVGRSTTSSEAFVPRRRVSGHRVADVSRATTCSHPSGIASSILVRSARNATEHGTPPPIVSPLDPSIDRFFLVNLFLVCLREYHHPRIHHHRISPLKRKERKQDLSSSFSRGKGIGPIEGDSSRIISGKLEDLRKEDREREGRRLAVVQIERTFFL